MEQKSISVEAVYLRLTLPLMEAITKLLNCSFLQVPTLMPSYQNTLRRRATSRWQHCFGITFASSQP